MCGALSNLHEHHIFYGTALRKISEQHGFKVRLCQWHHTGKEGVHFDKKLDTWLKGYAKRSLSVSTDGNAGWKLLGETI